MNASSDKEYIDNKVGDLRIVIDDLRVSMNERFNAVDAKIDAAVAKGVAEMIKWVVGLFITLIVLVVGLSSVVMNLVLRQPAQVASAPVSAPVLSTPAVIIQLSPQGATVLPAAPPAGKP